MSNGVRLASLADAVAVQNVSLAAYTTAYAEAVGYVPKPGQEDYRHRIRRGEVFVTEDTSGITGLLVLERHADWLLIYSVAVAPVHQNTGIGNLSWALLTDLPGNAESRRSGCLPISGWSGRSAFMSVAVLSSCVNGSILAVRGKFWWI